jgi:creatinine amidohydrolase
MLYNVNLAELTSPDIATAIESGYETVVFAVGSNEQHGPCLPVFTDALLGDELALSMAKKLGKALKGPTINVGCSEHHMKFPGTISMRKETLQNVIRDYVDSLARHGFRRIIVVPTHGGNFEPLAEVADDLRRSHSGVKVVTYTDLQRFVEVLQATSAKLGVTPEESGAHAGEAEASIMMWARGDLVKRERISEAVGYMGEFTDTEADTIFESGIGALSPIGVLGDPAKARKEHGERYIEELASALVDHISAN